MSKAFTEFAIPSRVSGDGARRGGGIHPWYALWSHLHSGV